MGSLSTPNTGEGTTNATPASGAAGETREGIEDHQIDDLEETCKAAPARESWSPQDPRPPPHIDKPARSFNSYQPAISQINKWGTNTLTKPPRKRAPSRHQTEIGDLRTHFLQWMNVTTCFMVALKTSIDRRQWPPNVNNTEICKGWGIKQLPNEVPRFKDMQKPTEDEEPSSKDIRLKSKSNPTGHAEIRERRVQHGNSIVTSFRVVEYEIPTGTGRGLT
uniref:Uncharacterized protein n=1 Tax=Brassica campestris TaxID=3711 RepID=M4FH12_BRACM